MNKPNWTNDQLDAAYRRWVDLIHETDSHKVDCACNSCMEEISLDGLLEMFSEDEHATAVIRINQGRGRELVNPILESEFIRG